MVGDGSRSSSSDSFTAKTCAFLCSALQFCSAKIVMLAENRDCVYERENTKVKVKSSNGDETRKERGW